MSIGKVIDTGAESKSERLGGGFGYSIDVESCMAQTSGAARSQEKNLEQQHILYSAPDLLKALEKAKQFIENGIELGYIIMPDADTPDSAHKTLPMINAAIASAKGE
jgi:hypothetical protein